MALPPPPAYRTINPRLGTYYAIIAAMVAGLTVFLLILEQLGTGRATLALAMLGGPIALTIALGMATYAAVPEDYFVAGRRVPAVYGGLTLAFTALGGAGLVTLTGTLFLTGFDALALGAGWTAGLVVMGIAIAPYSRKYGAYTVPGFLGWRFESRLLRLAAGVAFAIPCLLLLIAEIRIGAGLAATALARSPSALVSAGVIAVFFTIVLGGMRSHSWSGAAQSLIALLAIMVPAIILAVTLTNLPLPQLTYGGLMDEIARQERTWGLVPARAEALALALPGPELRALKTPFAAAFATMSPTSFLLVMVTVMAGVAAMPSLLARSGAAPSLHDVRRSVGWATLILALVVLTLPALAAFGRYILLDSVVGLSIDDAPAWLDMLRGPGLAAHDSQAAQITLAGLRFARDGVLLALPMIAGFPVVLSTLVLTGALAAVLAGAAAQLLTLANMANEDLLFALTRRPPDPVLRLTLARVLMGVVGAVAAWIALEWPADPLRLLLHAFSLSAATAFPVLVLAIWWKRANHWGALTGLLAGLVVTGSGGIAVSTGQPSWLGIDPLLAGVVFGLPAAFLTMVVVSLATRAPSEHVVDCARDLRLPGSEALYDREEQRARLEARRKSGAHGSLA